MLLPRSSPLLLAATFAQAFKNTSPFFLLSSTPLPSDTALRSAQVSLTYELEERLLKAVKECSWSNYHVVINEGATAQDLKNMPKLQDRIAGLEAGRMVEIPEVVAMRDEEAQGIVERLAGLCEGMGKRRVEGVPKSEGEFSIEVLRPVVLPLESKARAKALKETDTILDQAVESVAAAKEPALLMYITTQPSESASSKQDSDVYEMDEPYPSVLHTDLKRDTGLHGRQSNDSDDHMQDGLPLFEKYQFLSPPIFMGLSVSLLLLAILYVGIGAISGLEVSYMAFNKEMGPNAQKPKQ